MNLAPSTMFLTGLVALIVAFLIYLNHDRHPIAKNVAIGIVAVVLIIVCIELWMGFIKDMKIGRSTDCSRAGVCITTQRDASPVIFWFLAALKATLIMFFSYLSVLTASAAFRRHGYAG